MSTDLTFITNEKNQNLKDRAVTDLSACGPACRAAARAGAQAGKQQALQFSHSETKQEFQGLVEKELEGSEDIRQVEEGVVKFIEWIKSKKLEVRAYPSQNIHAKLYIMTFAEGDRDVGRVITGSSNFTQAGLVDNLAIDRFPYDFMFQLTKEEFTNLRFQFEISRWGGIRYLPYVFTVKI